jgi:hypothetical protein
VSLVDDIARLTAWQVAQIQDGPAASARQRCGLPASAIGKACGVGADVIYSWEQGLSDPTTQQGLAWLEFLRLHAPAFGVAAARSQAAQAAVAEAEKAKQEQARKAVEAGW